MIPLQIVCEHCQERDVPILDFPWFSEDLMQCTVYFRIVPVKFANEFEDFINSLLCEGIVDEMSDEEVHRRTLLDLFYGTFWRVALVIGVLEKQELPLIKMAHALFTPHELKLVISCRDEIHHTELDKIETYHLAERLLRALTSE